MTDDTTVLVAERFYLVGGPRDGDVVPADPRNPGNRVAIQPAAGKRIRINVLADPKRIDPNFADLYDPNDPVDVATYEHVPGRTRSRSPDFRPIPVFTYIAINDFEVA